MSNQNNDDKNLAARIRPYAPYSLYGLGILSPAGIVYVLYKEAPAIRRLRDPAYARGLITYFITLSTIGLAFVLVLQSFFHSGGAEEDRKASEDSFRRAPEVFFVALMGVLGTIGGSYFGSAEKAPVPLEIVEVRATEQQVLARARGVPGHMDELSSHRHTQVQKWARRNIESLKKEIIEERKREEDHALSIY